MEGKWKSLAFSFWWGSTLVYWDWNWNWNWSSTFVYFKLPTGSCGRDGDDDVDNVDERVEVVCLTYSSC